MSEIENYNPGLLNNWGGGNVSWWQDYLRSEIDRANDYWRSQVDNLLSSLEGKNKEIDYKGIKFFCKSCSKEIWENIEKDVNYTLPELDRDCICSDCILKEAK